MIFYLINSKLTKSRTFESNTAPPHISNFPRTQGFKSRTNWRYPAHSGNSVDVDYVDICFLFDVFEREILKHDQTRFIVDRFLESVSTIIIHILLIKIVAINTDNVSSTSIYYSIKIIQILNYEHYDITTYNNIRRHQIFLEGPHHTNMKKSSENFSPAPGFFSLWRHWTHWTALKSVKTAKKPLIFQ